MDLNLQGKVALVAASSKGLGKAVATQLAAEGCHVMLTGRDRQALSSAAREISALAPGRVESHCADLAVAGDICHLVQVTRATLGKIDILVNNSGGPPAGEFVQLSDDQWQSAFEATLLNYIRMIRKVLPDLKQSGGRIINIASSSIRQPIPGLILSNTFRLGILGLGKTLAEELAPYNILVNTVAPGRIATDRTAELDRGRAERLGVPVEQVEAESRGRIPLGRYGTPEEFARVVAFLASEASSYVTGSALLVDGGMVRAI
ncbi:3-oxoacyl-ACP reductase [Desulfuromonas versatilis]|uniref:3-oxoacyl-ACP reductase n=1 Tax=Desulfuromonas versatilis TaxID=2802975 RepID=A0ABM8HXD4_9BACT|nr:SDR family oxidoreductase [Desulfuromonas versatilis]BCR06676.1 3-oxoacyl-ACP reductase [Desulfuromonas versatilis]